MQVFTTLDTLSEAWALLEELKLGGILTGKTAAFEAEELLGLLLKGRKLQEFLAVITHADPQDLGDIELEQALGLLNDFFAGIGGALKALPILQMELGAKEAPKKPRPKTSA